MLMPKDQNELVPSEEQAFQASRCGFESHRPLQSCHLHWYALDKFAVLRYFVTFAE